MKNLIKTPLFIVLMPVGLIYFLITGKTTGWSYIAFRHLFVVTNGRLNDWLSRFIRLVKPPKHRTNQASILGALDSSEITAICNSISRDGYYQFDVNLPEQHLNQLVHLAQTTGAKSIDLTKKGVQYKSEKELFNPSAISSPRYQFEAQDILQDTAVQDIVFDTGLYAIASTYLGCEPILDIVTMWWSAPFNNEGTAQAAQMYHFDMDRFKFIKFFFYLTDVHTDNGPHCYVRNSHVRIPAQVRKDRRIRDEELTNFYPAEDIKEFTGKRGTILAVDTRGLHKGKPLVRDNRLLFQLQFSNALFGAPTEPMVINNPTDIQRQVMQTYNRTYQLIAS